MTDEFISDHSPETNGKPPVEPGNDAVLTIGADDPLAKYVGEGKKYKSTEDLARAIEEKDSFIEKLKEEGSGMREDITRMQEQLTEAKTLDDVLSKITASRDSESNQPLDGDEVRKLVDAALEERITEKERASNLKEAQDALLGRFDGDKGKANEYVADKAKSLGMSTKDLLSIATKSPAGFKELVGLDQKATPSGGTPSGRDSESAFNGMPREPEVGTKQYYDKLRRENPAEYWKPATQQKMMRDADRDFDKFMGRKS